MTSNNMMIIMMIMIITMIIYSVIVEQKLIAEIVKNVINYIMAKILHFTSKSINIFVRNAVPTFSTRNKMDIFSTFYCPS